MFSGLNSISRYNDETQKSPSSDLIIAGAMSLLVKSSIFQDGRYDLIHALGWNDFSFILAAMIAPFFTSSLTRGVKVN